MKALAFISPVTPSKFMKKPGFQNPEQLKRQTASALFQLEAATKNLSDSLSVFIRNYQLGLKGKDMIMLVSTLYKGVLLTGKVLSTLKISMLR